MRTLLWRTVLLLLQTAWDKIRHEETQKKKKTKNASSSSVRRRRPNVYTKTFSTKRQPVFKSVFFFFHFSTMLLTTITLFSPFWIGVCVCNILIPYKEVIQILTPSSTFNWNLRNSFYIVNVRYFISALRPRRPIQYNYSLRPKILTVSNRRTVWRWIRKK